MILNDLCELIVDCEHKTAPKSEAGYPSIRVMNVGRGRLILDGVNRVDEATYLEWTRRAVPQAGDLIVAREAPLGNVAIIQPGQKVCLGQRTVLVRPDAAKVDPAFLCYFMLGNYVQDRFQAMSTGATVPHLNMKDIRGLHLPPLPPLPTQQRIAAILSAYDDLIETNTRRIAILDEMARRLYEEWFVHFRYPGHEAAEFDGDLPRGWEQRPLGEACSRITDGAHKSPPSAASGLPMASVKDMHAWGLDLSGSRLISAADFEELVRNSCKPQRNDILVAKDGANLNKHTFLVTEEEDVVLLSSIAILRPGEDMHPEFLVAQLKSEEVNYRIKMMRSGAAIPRIVLKDFKRLDVLVPPREMQEEWVALAGPMHALCRSLVNKNANLRAQRDLLLPKLVSSEIDVSGAEAALEAAE